MERTVIIEGKRPEGVAPRHGIYDVAPWRHFFSGRGAPTSPALPGTDCHCIASPKRSEWEGRCAPGASVGTLYTMEPLINTHRWAHLYTARRLVIACATVIEEMTPFLPGDVSSETLDFGLHLQPNHLKAVLQEKIDAASPHADVLLLGYGLCSMAVVGLRATTAHLVIPRVDDCIAIFLGSCNAYKQQAEKEPGTYYLTKGWIEVGDSPFSEYQRLVQKFGEDKALRMIQLMLKNYTRLGFINTGQYEIDRYRDYARKTAEQFNLRFEEIDGSPALVKKMVFGPWDDEFVVVAPGETVQYTDFVQLQPIGQH